MIYIILPVLLIKIGLGFLYYKNKDYINTKILNKSSEIILYTKKNILSKCINKDFYITDAILIHNNIEINIYYYLFYNMVSNKIKKFNTINNELNNNELNNNELNNNELNNKISNFTNKLYNEILEYYDIKHNEDTRILIKYKLNNTPYLLYWTGSNLKNPIITNEYIKKLKNRYFIYNNKKESVYMLLIVEMKNIIDIKYNINLNDSNDSNDLLKLNNSESNILQNNSINLDKNNKLIELFSKLKGPMNDYGFLLNCPIKNKWIYDDFNLMNVDINLKQGYKINESFNLESFERNIKYDNNYIVFDIFNNI